MPRKGVRKDNQDEGSDMEMPHTQLSKLDGSCDISNENSQACGGGDSLELKTSKQPLQTAEVKHNATSRPSMPLGSEVQLVSDLAQQADNSKETLESQTVNHDDLASIIQAAVQSFGQVAQNFMKDATTWLERLQAQSVQAPVTRVIDHYASTHSPPIRAKSSSQSRAVRRFSQTVRVLSDESSSGDDNSVGYSCQSASRLTWVRPSPAFPKLPPFTGKESWRVWFNRFDEVASRQSWFTSDKLDQLLPRLQGPADEFVFDQLDRRTRSDYGALVQQLESRFRKVETLKTFAAAFSNCNQKPGESVEEFAAELKKLYTKRKLNGAKNGLQVFGL